MKLPISEATRERLIEADLNAGMCAVCQRLDPFKYDIEPENCERCAGVRVDAIVAALIAALIAEGWRDMRLVESPEALAAYRADGRAETTPSNEAFSAAVEAYARSSGTCHAVVAAVKAAYAVDFPAAPPRADGRAETEATMRPVRDIYRFAWDAMQRLRNHYGYSDEAERAADLDDIAAALRATPAANTESDR